MIRGARVRVKFLGVLQDDLDVRLGHQLPQIPIYDVATVAIQNAAQAVERPADVDVRHVRYASADALPAAAQSPCPSSTACRSIWTKALPAPTHAIRWSD